KIMASAGIQYQGSFFSELAFRNEVMTAERALDPIDSGVTYTNRGTTNSNLISKYEMSQTYLEFTDKFTLSGSVTGFTYSGGNLVSTSGGRYRFTTDTTWTNVDGY